MHKGSALPQSGQIETAPITGMTQADVQAAGEIKETITGMTQADVQAAGETEATSASGAGVRDTMPDMPMHMTFTRERPAKQSASSSSASGLTKGSASHGPTELNGCLTLLDDGRAMLKTAPSSKIYRVEGQPLGFSKNANRTIHVTGELGSVVADEDPNIPSFVVATIDELAPDCSVKITPALVRKVLAKASGASPTDPLTVGMNGMTFVPPKITVKVGQKVTWKDSSDAIHNVVTDAGKATNVTDVHIPTGVRPFDSGWMQPGKTFSHVFTTPGTYHYVCTLHEGYGMKGTVIVK
jgi:plastocyanin